MIYYTSYLPDIPICLLMLDADIGSFQSLEINWPQTVKTVNQHFKIYKQFKDKLRMTNNSWAIHKRVTLRHNDGGLQTQNISMCRTPPNLTSQGETLVRGIARHRLGVFVQSSDNMIGSCLAELSGFMPMSWSHWSCQHCHGFYIAKKMYGLWNIILVFEIDTVIFFL